MSAPTLQSIRIERPSPERLAQLDVESWPIWEKDISQFSSHYGETETCYLLQGRVEVTNSEGTVEFAAGDLVVLPQGLTCTWHVKQPVRKRYRAGAAW